MRGKRWEWVWMRRDTEIDKISSMTKSELCVIFLLSLHCQMTGRASNLSLIGLKKI